MYRTHSNGDVPSASIEILEGDEQEKKILIIIEQAKGMNWPE